MRILLLALLLLPLFHSILPAGAIQATATVAIEAGPVPAALSFQAGHRLLFLYDGEPIPAKE